MIKYYKLFLLRKTEYNQLWGKIYLGITDERYDIINQIIQEENPLAYKIKEISKEEAIGLSDIVQEKKPLDSRLKRISKEEVIGVLNLDVKARPM